MFVPFTGGDPRKLRRRSIVLCVLCQAEGHGFSDGSVAFFFLRGSSFTLSTDATVCRRKEVLMFWIQEQANRRGRKRHKKR